MKDWKTKQEREKVFFALFSVLLNFNGQFLGSLSFERILVIFPPSPALVFINFFIDLTTFSQIFQNFRVWVDQQNPIRRRIENQTTLNEELEQNNDKTRTKIHSSSMPEPDPSKLSNKKKNVKIYCSRKKIPSKRAFWVT